jgi:hypothetical protein
MNACNDRGTSAHLYVAEEAPMRDHGLAVIRDNWTGEFMLLASLPMYDLPETEDATRILWRG